MSQYNYQNGNLIQDNQVPFVRTISRLTRDGNGNLTEYQMPIEMPALKGSSAEFIHNLTIPHYSNKVFKLNDISQSSFMIGHIFGGISSSSSNPFANNQTNTTSADNTIYEVWFTLNPTSINEMEIDGKNPYSIDVLPNPFTNDFTAKFNTRNAVNVTYFITNNLGEIIQKADNKLYSIGDNEFKINLSKTKLNGVLFLTVVFDNKYFVTKKLIKQ